MIGSPGAGKSTLARKLSARTGLPIHHLDQIFWRSGWIERDKAEWGAALETVLAQPRWIIDGNYGSTLPQRLERADTVVWLDFPTALCLVRLAGRWWQHRGHTRPDMTEGCPERLDPAFLLYTLNFRRTWHGRNAAALRDFRGNVARLRSPAQAQDWLANA